ncbi:Integrase core domain-containing protein [Paraburkholderia steynii]|uniref:Integrase core domain-containing protein n=1 Tax=Paraburkholderia steynii TaxID=1245441 RepID=A0A7Z7BA54_9BURK|nr:Mu transposase C-terminal domain-containing protein [Paraburkholderia steynii]SDI39131.1 Integrase core domain-containing protein [Paraburkholderia steynii]
MNEHYTVVPLSLGMLLREANGNRTFRIVTPEGAGFDAMLYDIDDKNAWPFAGDTEAVQQRLRPETPAEKKLVVELDDPWSPLLRPPRPKYDKVKLERDWQLIQPLVRPPVAYRVMLPQYRNTILVEHAKLNRTTRQKLTRVLRRYWQRGLSRNALMDDMDKCGGKGKPKVFADKKNGRRRKDAHPGAPLTETVRKVLRIAADWLFADRPHRTYQDALDRIAVSFGNVHKVIDPQGCQVVVGLDPALQPTVRQLQDLVLKDHSYAVRRRAQLGVKGFDLTGRAFHGRADQHFPCPGHVVLDATIADIYLLSQFDRTTIVGRPTVYLAIDIYSRLIVGIYVGFEPPSWVAAMILMCNVVTPKVAYCAQFGVEITEDQWPCHSMPTTLFGDKGEMMKIQGGQLLSSELGIRILNAPSGRPDCKSIVELRFNTIQRKWAAFAPGYVKKDFDERGARDYRLDAALTLYEFTQLMILAVIQHNSAPISDFPSTPDMAAEGAAPTPVELWNYGIQSASGNLRNDSISQIRRYVLPRDTATVTHKGIEFRKNFYQCPSAAKGDWLVKARGRRWRVSVAYDPRDLGLIWLCEKGMFEECTRAGTNALDIDPNGVSLVEWEVFQEQATKNLSRAQDEHLPTRVQVTLASDQIVSKALQEKARALKIAGLKKLSTDDIRDAGAREKALDRIGAAGPDSDLSIGPAAAASPRRSPRQTNGPRPYETDEPNPASIAQRGKAKALDLIKKARST